MWTDFIFHWRRKWCTQRYVCYHIQKLYLTVISLHDDCGFFLALNCHSQMRFPCSSLCYRIISSKILSNFSSSSICKYNCYCSLVRFHSCLYFDFSTNSDLDITKSRFSLTIAESCLVFQTFEYPDSHHMSMLLDELLVFTCWVMELIAMLLIIRAVTLYMI